MPNTREKLIEFICSVEYGNGSLVGNNFQRGFIEKIADHLIANDVVPVVRCKDCIWFSKTGYNEENDHEDDLNLHMGHCSVLRTGTQACRFCSYGERREGE